MTYPKISRNVPVIFIPCQVTDGALINLEIQVQKMPHKEEACDFVTTTTVTTVTFQYLATC